jgi:capsular exopolysaccharide synthesis family protein
VEGTAVIDIAAESTIRTKAARAATAYAEAYVDYRGKRTIDSLLSATKELQRQIDDLDKQIADADSRAFAANPPKPGVAPALSPEQSSLRTQRSAFKEKLDQLNVDAAVKNGGAQLVSPATVAATPIRPTTRRNLLLGAVVGLIIGTALAFVTDQLDDSLKTTEDLARLVGTLPVLGVIPRVPGWRNRAEARVPTQTQPNSPVAEAYRALRTSIQFFGVDRSMRTIQVTSATPGDGKTTTVANLGVVLARAGQTVVVVSCDLRRPRIHEFFGLENSVGFTSLLLGTHPLSAGLQQVPDEGRLYLLPSGPLPPNPSELLSSERAKELLVALQARFDTVLIDCPPVLPVTDAAVLSSRVDGTLLVATAGTTTGKQLSRSVDLLRQVDAPLVGVVFNGAPSEAPYAYGYRYHGEARPPDRRAGTPSRNGSTKKTAERSADGASTEAAAT